jgi:pyruvate/2-oxoglutarate dehydrogenase complex dihydrolipoamide dehydrogenase (E3) component
MIMPIEHFQNQVIGSGAAGKILAWTLAKEGQTTVVVERSMIGGSCVNVGCLPSKNVIYSAKAVSLITRPRAWGGDRVNACGHGRRRPAQTPDGRRADRAAHGEGQG